VKRIGNKSITDVSVNVCLAAAYEATRRRVHLRDALREDVKFSLMAVTKIMQIEPLAKIRNSCDQQQQNFVTQRMCGASHNEADTLVKDLFLCTIGGTLENKRVPSIPGLVHKNMSTGDIKNELQEPYPSIPPKLVTRSSMRPDRNPLPKDSTTQGMFPSMLTVPTIRRILRSGISSSKEFNQSRQDLDKLSEIQQRAQSRQSSSSARTPGIVVDSDERSRRGAVWEDALRELSISGDRLYTFMKTLAGTLFEDVTDILRLEDRSMAANQRNMRDQQREITKSVTVFGQKLLDGLLTNIFKQSNLKVDMTLDATGAADSLTNSLVVLSSDNVEEIRNLATGQSGLPFFQQRVDLDRALRQNTGKPMPLRVLVAQITDILEQYRTQAIDRLGEGMTDGTQASLQFLAEPRNSYVIRMKNETYAAIRRSFDMLSTEAGLHGIQDTTFTAWECIEGDDRQLRDQFAQLCAYGLAHARVSSARESAYVSVHAQKANSVNLRMSLQKTVNRLREYIARRRGGIQPQGYMRSVLHVDARDISALSNTM
jgi:hypothetical protein